VCGLFITLGYSRDLFLKFQYRRTNQDVERTQLTYWCMVFQSYTLLKGLKTVLFGDLLSIIPLSVCHTARIYQNTNLEKKYFDTLLVEECRTIYTIHDALIGPNFLPRNFFSFLKKQLNAINKFILQSCSLNELLLSCNCC
jgi:hypothetical protein